MRTYLWLVLFFIIIGCGGGNSSGLGNGALLLSGSITGELNDLPFSMTYGVIGNLDTPLNGTVLALSTSPIDCSTEFNNFGSTLPVGTFIAFISFDNLNVGTHDNLSGQLSHVEQMGFGSTHATNDTTTEITSASDSDVEMTVAFDTSDPDDNFSGTASVKHCL